MSGLDHVPDVRDGLTHVERRLLHWLGPPKTPRRPSRLVVDDARRGTDLTRGEVYEALVRLAQPWVTRYPLVSGKGNFGSLDDDPPAASRYTEARLARRADALFGGGDARVAPGGKSTAVDFTAPLTGPRPNLLANGSHGGLASIPPHQLNEVARAALLRLDDPSAGLDRVLAVMPGPDYPTGGELVDREEIRAAYEAGHGQLQLRGSVHVEIDDDAQHSRVIAEAKADPNRMGAAICGIEESDVSPQEWERLTFVAPARQRIVVTEVAFGTTKGGDEGFIVQAVERIWNGPLSAVDQIEDLSDRRGMRMVFEVRDDADPRETLARLLELTDLEVKVPVLLVALVDGKPEQLNLLELIDHYLAHQRSVRPGSATEIDAAIRRDLAAFAGKKAGKRRTRLPGLAG